VDSNHGPLHYQCSALTTWATSPHACAHTLDKIYTTTCTYFYFNYILWKILKQLCLSSTIKEVFQPHLPVRLPCYDLAPVISFTLNAALQLTSLGPPNFHGLTGGVYKVRERIHRAIADARLLAIPTSWSRVADSNPNCDRFFEIGITSQCSYCLLYTSDAADDM
jgi:hypothetical protein